MKAILIEDNPSARKSFLNLLNEYCPDIQLIGQASNVAEGIATISASQPDLMFLDIEMPDGNGFDLLQKLPEISFQVIFVSSHEKYALRAIKSSALDYILKPIDPEELVEAVEKAKSEFEHHKTQQRVQTLINNISSQSKEPTQLILKDKYGIQIVSIKDIIHLEANGSYTKFFINGQDNLLVSKGLKDYENILSSQHFFRCHQSHLINLDYLLRYDKRDGDFLVLKDKSKVPLATRKKESLLKIINAK
ncbi:LytR/AlgR family response regulator transcription factor [Aquimarina sediminis]|uniref:LytR/AlgR family response regulator transcription factor n=1 Tax=Aquimarina sediminis TaxID=2070536 RepID=UPI000CA00BAD|nr:LytTR family DNA-binding domain-containing protein [Aquimarina sediminis]